MDTDEAVDYVKKYFREAIKPFVGDAAVSMRFVAERLNAMIDLIEAHGGKVEVHGDTVYVWPPPVPNFITVKFKFTLEDEDVK